MQTVESLISSAFHCLILTLRTRKSCAAYFSDFRALLITELDQFYFIMIYGILELDYVTCCNIQAKNVLYYLKHLVKT